MAVQTYGNIKFVHNISELDTNENDLNTNAVSLIHNYTFDSGNTTDTPLPSGANPMNAVFHNVVTATGNDSGGHASYNLDSVTGNFLGKELVINFDTIYSVLITSTDNKHMKLQGHNYIEPTGTIFGNLLLAFGVHSVVVNHELPFCFHNTSSGIDPSILTIPNIAVVGLGTGEVTHEISIIGSVTG